MLSCSLTIQISQFYNFRIKLHYRYIQWTMENLFKVIIKLPYLNETIKTWSPN